MSDKQAPAAHDAAGPPAGWALADPPFAAVRHRMADFEASWDAAMAAGNLWVCSPSPDGTRMVGLVALFPGQRPEQPGCAPVPATVAGAGTAAWPLLTAAALTLIREAIAMGAPAAARRLAQEHLARLLDHALDDAEYLAAECARLGLTVPGEKEG